MFQTQSFVDKIRQIYAPPEKVNVSFDDKDIEVFETALGIALPSDYYEFLHVYGYGSFDDYFYIWHPFIKQGIEHFVDEQKQVEKNYQMLERHLHADYTVDGTFTNDELVILRGDTAYAETLRPEKTDNFTRAKIIAFGNHYPYPFFPEKEGLIYFGRTDDDDFFLRLHDHKTSIVIYRSDYYEFDMGFSEFVYYYLTCKIKIAMSNDESEWTFIPYEDQC